MVGSGDRKDTTPQNAHNDLRLPAVFLDPFETGERVQADQLMLVNYPNVVTLSKELDSHKNSMRLH